MKWCLGLALAWLNLVPAMAREQPNYPPTPAQVSVCFVPANVCDRGIAAAIAQSTRTIRVQAYGFSSPPILQALATAKKRGVEVAILLDKSNARGKYSGATFMANAGVPVAIDVKPAIAHNNIIIIDDHMVIGGSFNYTSSAEARNAENVSYIDSPAIAGWYTKNWLSRQAVSVPYQPGIMLDGKAGRE